MRVYLDNCAYNRPFDDQRAILVYTETPFEPQPNRFSGEGSPLDYTEWQYGLYKDVSLDEFCRNVKKFKEKQTKEAPNARN